MERVLKAFIIALTSLRHSVRFVRHGDRARVELKSFEHPLLVFLLSLVFDVRQTPSGRVWIAFRAKDAVAVRRRAQWRRHHPKQIARSVT